MSERWNLQALLKLTREAGGSILHINCGLPPVTRNRHTLLPLHEGKFTPEDCDRLAAGLLGRQSVLSVKSATVRGREPELGTYRAAIYRQRDVPNIVIKLQPLTPMPLEELGLPTRVEEMMAPARGLILVCGPSRSGKTWTLGALARRFHRLRAAHTLILGQAADFEYPLDQGLVTRQPEEDTDSWKQALQWAGSSDVDAVVLDGMSSLNQVESALDLAQSKLVMAGLNDNDYSYTAISGVAERFPAGRHLEMRYLLAHAFRGCLAQRIVAGASRGAEHLAVEIVVGTPHLRSLIREDRCIQFSNAVDTGAKYGMQSLDRSLLDLYRSGRVDRDTALDTSLCPSELDRMMKRLGAGD